MQRCLRRRLNTTDEKGEQWFKLVESRPENYAQEWLETMHCPVIRVDGTKSVCENIDYILEQIKLLKENVNDT